ncbi:MAG: divergent polysaccharide deacetylase family protein [Candidatus Lambdaproteobacteria bacterium]|nr:divergent polysaccharide deacetylase family protein [Candidatus Lambdaproteobacteria bacterium]
MSRLRKMGRAGGPRRQTWATGLSRGLRAALTSIRRAAGETLRGIDRMLLRAEQALRRIPTRLRRLPALLRRHPAPARRAVYAGIALVGAVTAVLLLRGLAVQFHWDLGRSPALVLLHQPPDADRAPLYPDMPFGPPAPRQRPPTPPPAGEPPRLAIVIDDIGHNQSAPRRFLALGLPLTFSILPGLPYTASAARQVSQARRDFIIHLPMEPEGYPQVDPGPLPLLLGQSEDATVERLREIMSELPGAFGASNHMGSAYTLDREKMALVQALLAERNLVFLNSMTVNTAVPRAVARSGHFPFLERDVFLDNVRSVPAITRELHHALRVARRRGQAVAIGHPYPQTLRALRDTFPALAGGVELVSLSALRRPYDSAPAPNPEPQRVAATVPHAPSPARP